MGKWLLYGNLNQEELVKFLKLVEFPKVVNTVPPVRVLIGYDIHITGH